MERNQFTFYKSYWEAVKGLPKKDRESALEAIIEYAIYEELPQKLTPVANSVFVLTKPTLDKGRNKAANAAKEQQANTKQIENKTETNSIQTVQEGEEEREIE